MQMQFRYNIGIHSLGVERVEKPKEPKTKGAENQRSRVSKAARDLDELGRRGNQALEWQR